MSTEHLQWWSNLRHGGLLLDMQRLSDLVPVLPAPLAESKQEKLRKEMIAFQEDPDDKRSRFVTFVLQELAGFSTALGGWYRGSRIDRSWTRRGFLEDAIRPDQLWTGEHDSNLPVFLDHQKKLGIGKGKRILAQALQWLRQGNEQLAVVSNGRQWRIVFAGLDYEAFCEWDIEQWFSEGQTSPEFDGFRALLSPPLWISEEKGKPCRFAEAVHAGRKGQADLSQELGERVRQAAELLIQGHAPVLNAYHGQLKPDDIYRAAVHMIMRMVVVLFAESREGLLPRDNPIYHNAYGLQGLRELLERAGTYKRVGCYAAYPRILALFRLIYQGSGHEAMPVPAYGGELFAPGNADSADGMKRALHLFETACFAHDIMNDFQVGEILDLLTRTRVTIRQGRASLIIPAPVDFSSLDSEYIGILYEGLLDFELRCADETQPIVFLAVGYQPALPLTTLEEMNDASIKNLFEKLKDTSSDDDMEDVDMDEPAEEEEELPDEETIEETDVVEQTESKEISDDDPHYTLRARAENWARHACEVGKLVTRPRGKMTLEKKMKYEDALVKKARQIVTKVVLPGEWYLVRWGGTRKGSGTFYTRPQLAIPTVHRTLRPLAFNPPLSENGEPDDRAPASQWLPKKPEHILSLKICDPACGSGSFCLSALRFLTNALFESLLTHKRVRDHAGRAVLDLIFDEEGKECLASEALPCRPDDDDFEVRTKAVLRRYIVERCIYGVDLDPLAVELCRLSLWIETLDRRLPMTFLEHKIKIGNSLAGAWFDQFQHYPAMAWEREGGDKNHTNGAHFDKEEWTKAIKDRKSVVKTELIQILDAHQPMLPEFLEKQKTQIVHDAAEKALREIHELGITEVPERQEKYERLRNDAEFRRLQEAFDLWCALWFWPPDAIERAPMPREFIAGDFSDEIREIIRTIASERRFFHWELEFPDVFNATSRGFDAVLGNPPWDISKPVSKEFFSAVDPLYRSYGKQEAVGKQRDFFQRDEEIEILWLQYNAYFRAMSNWVKYAGFPFGDQITTDSNGKDKHDFNLGSGGKHSFYHSQSRHDRWKEKREDSIGYADEKHAFRHQGSGDINLYKMFLEQAHALLNENGRFGFIVPSGLYSDYGTGALRTLFVDQSRWEWLFGFENRDKVFDIDSRFKFNPVIIQKGGQTEAIRTAFMRRKLADWERAEELATAYPRERVLQFSPNSRAILEIQSQRDLEVLEKIYSNSVLLGDQSEKGWGIKYATEFHMTNDSKLFPPRTKWEEWGYRPDEYSRWIKGPWKPLDQLWPKLGVSPLPEGQTRLAQPPYHKLPIPRADIPPGIILSREATHFIREEEIPVVTFTDASGKVLKIKTGSGKKKVEQEVRGSAIALPLYEGRMIGQFDFSQKGWVSGTGRGAVWRDIGWVEKNIEPQYLMGRKICSLAVDPGMKLPIMNIGSSTNQRTIISTIIIDSPCNHALNPIRTTKNTEIINSLNAIMNSFIFDAQVRMRLVGLNISFFVLDELSLKENINLVILDFLSSQLCLTSNIFAIYWLKSIKNSKHSIISKLALTMHERLRKRLMIDAIIASYYEINLWDYNWLLKDCDYPEEVVIEIAYSRFDPKGFWRVDKDKPPEHRLTVLSLVAFHDLQQKIEEYGGDVEKGIEAFCNQNGGEGWMLPETLRLADYGLGHDERAKEHQPVRECFGPRFYPWQLAQSAEESWRECRLHARNLLGAEGYQALLDELEGKSVEKRTEKKQDEPPDGFLFDVNDTPLFEPG